MNFKTTLYLAAALVLVAAVVWLGGVGQRTRDVRPPKVTALLTDRPVIPEDFGQVVKLTCTRRDGEQWAFQRAEVENGDEFTKGDWNVTAPFKARAASWQVDGLIRRLTGLSYQVKHTAGQAGAVAPTQAGLEPPVATVALENEDGKTVTVEVGRDVSEREAYVRLAGSGDIYVVSASLDNLLKDKAVEYRDQQLFDFAADNVTRLEINDGSRDNEAVAYTLVRSDTGWVFESPIKARAVSDKIDSAVKAMAKLRMSTWVEVRSDAPAMFGLGEGGITVRATVEETPQPAETERYTEQTAEQENQPAPEPVIAQYVLHLSRRSPIGEATKVYAAKAGDPAVGTITKTIADRMTPDLAEWRDTRLTIVPVTKADRIELTTPAGSATFKLDGGKWVDADAATAIDTGTVNELLKQIGDLRARGEVPIEESDPAALGLDEPRADIRLNVPGQERTQRFTVGGYTDAKTRRMVYLRVNQGDSAAKVRVGEVNKLTRAPTQYLDRTVLDLRATQIERIAITRQDDLAGGTFAFALTKVDNNLQITEPAAVRTSAMEVKKLTGALASLTATRVLGPGDPAQYGLDAPVVTCDITRQPPEMTKYVEVEADEATEADEPESDQEEGEEGEAGRKPEYKAEKYTPPAEHYTLRVGEHDGKVYATRGDGVIYQVGRKVLDLLRAELHQPGVLEFEQSQVVSVTVADPDGTVHTFAKVNDRWQYTPEPDLPIDASKVADLLLRVANLKTERYVSYGPADPADYGLDAPWRSVTVKLDDGRERRLLVSQHTCPNDEEGRRYAVVEPNGDGVLLLTGDTIARFEIDLAEYETP